MKFSLLIALFIFLLLGVIVSVWVTITSVNNLRKYEFIFRNSNATTFDLNVSDYWLESTLEGFGHREYNLQLKKDLNLSDDWWKSALEALAKVTKKISQGDPESALSFIFEMAGPLGSLLSEIFGLGSAADQPYKEILLKLDGLSFQLSSIQDKLEHLVDEFTLQILQLKLREVDESVSYLNQEFTKFSKTPSTAYRDNFIRVCRKEDMSKTVFALHSEMTDTLSELSLFHQISRNLDRKLFIQVSVQVISTVSLASSLHLACLHAQGLVQGNGTISFENLQRLKGEGTDMSKKLDDISKAVKLGDSKIRDNFMPQAVMDSEDYLKNHWNDWDHEKLAQDLLDFLESKYYWRYWAVGCYDVRAGTWDEHSFLGGSDSHVWIRQYNRNAFIAHTSKNNQKVGERKKSGLRILSGDGNTTVANLEVLSPSDICLKNHDFIARHRSDVYGRDAAWSLMTELQNCLEGRASFTLIAAIHNGGWRLAVKWSQQSLIRVRWVSLEGGPYDKIWSILNPDDFHQNFCLIFVPFH